MCLSGYRAWPRRFFEWLDVGLMTSLALESSFIQAATIRKKECPRKKNNQRILMEINNIVDNGRIQVLL